MPDFTSHHIFGQQVKAACGERVRQQIAENEGAFCWGQQGPDLLFFHRAILAGSPLPQYGRTMHGERTALLFESMAHTLVERRKCLDFDILLPYFYGFICHYAMDSHLHPYVFSLQREMERGQVVTDNRCHWQIESGIDDELYALVSDESIRRFPVATYYKVNSDVRIAIAGFLSKALAEVYAITVAPRDLVACFADALWINKALYNKNGLSKPAATVVQKLIGRDGQLTAHFKGGGSGHDYLNLAHKSWRNLAENEREQTDSVLDLIEQAKAGALELIELSATAIGRGDWRKISQYPFTKSFVHGKFREIR